MMMMFVSGFRSSATRFRWIQNYYQEQDEWALDDIYIGQQCPQMCRGHGWCDHGHCRSARNTGTHCETAWVFLGYVYQFRSLNCPFFICLRPLTPMGSQNLISQGKAELSGLIFLEKDLTLFDPTWLIYIYFISHHATYLLNTGNTI